MIAFEPLQPTFECLLKSVRSLLCDWLHVLTCVGISICIKSPCFLRQVCVSVPCPTNCSFADAAQSTRGVLPLMCGLSDRNDDKARQNVRSKSTHKPSAGVVCLLPEHGGQFDTARARTRKARRGLLGCSDCVSVSTCLFQQPVFAGHADADFYFAGEVALASCALLGADFCLVSLSASSTDDCVRCRR